jgi:hypothetical protein
VHNVFFTTLNMKPAYIPYLFWATDVWMPQYISFNSDLLHQNTVHKICKYATIKTLQTLHQW